MGSERRVRARARSSALRPGALSHPFTPLPTPPALCSAMIPPRLCHPRAGAAPRPASAGPLRL